MTTLKTVEQRIIDYLAEKSRGKLRLEMHHATHIKRIVLGQDGSLLGSATAKKYHFNPVKGGYEIYRTIPTTDGLINERIKEALAIGPIERSYKYELYDSSGEFAGNILTINANLFD